MRTLLLDIETTPNIVYRWDLFDSSPVQLNQLIYPSRVLCFAAKWKGTKKVEFFDGRDGFGEFDPGSDVYADMIFQAHTLLTDADVVVHFNGDRFDIPILNSEFAIQGFRKPAPFKSIDHYKTYKQNFKLPSGKLAYLTKALGLEGKVAHEGFDLWVKCMQSDKKAWRTMKRYNIGDVQQLDELDDLLASWVPSPPNIQLYDDVLGCPTCGQDDYQSRGYRYTTVGKYRRFQCNNCGRWFSSGKRVQGVDLR